jgi:hypothetical protein
MRTLGHFGSSWFSAMLSLFGLVSGCASAPVPRLGCADVHHNEWLSACAFALYAVDRLEHPAPDSDPWKVLSRFVFEADEHLAEQFSSACDHLMEEPWRLSERDRPWLIRSGWPPVKRICSRAQHIEWLRACEADAKSLVGQPRRQLLVFFREEGGLSTRTQRSYVHRRCAALKVLATFLPAGDAGEWGESADDLVDKAVLYIDPFVVVD